LAKPGEQGCGRKGADRDGADRNGAGRCKDAQVARPKKKNMPPGTRDGPPSRIVQLKRFVFVEKLLMEDMLQREIVERAKAELGIAERTTHDYIRRVYESWKEAHQRDREELRAHAIMRAKELIGKMGSRLDAGKNDPYWADMVRAQELLAKLEGTLAPQEHKVDVRSRFEQWTIEELDRYIETGQEPEWYLEGDLPPPREAEKPN